jgi:hypothetical protein
MKGLEVTHFKTTAEPALFVQHTCLFSVRRIVNASAFNGEDPDMLQDRWRSAWLERIDRHDGNITMTA